MFRFDVPLEAGVAVSPAAAGGAAALRGRRVILVEDNPTNRSILEAQLRGFGMDVATADNGATALELLRAAARAGTPFDAAIVDMKMPIMDGLTMATELRRDPLLVDVRMVMLTSLGSGNEARLAYDSGIEAYLTKPVRQAELVDALGRVLLREAPSVAGAAHLCAGTPRPRAGRRGQRGQSGGRTRDADRTRLLAAGRRGRARGARRAAR